MNDMMAFPFGRQREPLGQKEGLHREQVRLGLASQKSLDFEDFLLYRYPLYAASGTNEFGGGYVFFTRGTPCGEGASFISTSSSPFAFGNLVIRKADFAGLILSNTPFMYFLTSSGAATALASGSRYFGFDDESRIVTG